jgi:hypothetical protein
MGTKWKHQCEKILMIYWKCYNEYGTHQWAKWGCHIGILVQTAEKLRTYYAFAISTSPVSLNPET